MSDAPVYCCSMMEGNSVASCAEHADDPASCPDVTIAHSSQRGVGLPIPSSAGGGQICIQYCPWCAAEIGHPPFESEGPESPCPKCERADVLIWTDPSQGHVWCMNCDYDGLWPAPSAELDPDGGAS